MQGILSTLSVEHGLNTLKRLGWQAAGIIDVGAYQGQWSVMAKQIFPDAHILMIEPQARLEETR